MKKNSIDDSKKTDKSIRFLRSPLKKIKTNKYKHQNLNEPDGDSGKEIIGKNHKILIKPFHVANQLDFDFASNNHDFVINYQNFNKENKIYSDKQEIKSEKSVKIKYKKINNLIWAVCNLILFFPLIFLF